MTTRDEVDAVLAHHGIKGMKWGFRRRTSSKLSASSQKASGQWTKSSKRLTNEELQSRIRRLELEQRYSQLSQTNGQRLRAKGKQAVENAVFSTAQKALSKTAETAFTKATGISLKSDKKKKSGD